MGLFGTFKQPMMPGLISGYGGGTFNMDGTQATPVMSPIIPTGDFGPRPAGIEEAAAYVPPVRKGGVFGSGIKWQQIAGALADGLFAANGNESMPYTMIQQQRRSQENLLKRQALENQQELQRQIALYDYKRQNPDPGDDSFTRALAAANIMPGTPEYMQMARKRAEMLTNPVQLVSDGMGGFAAVRPNSMGGNEAPPTAPVGKLRPLGGPAGNGGGMFP